MVNHWVTSEPDLTEKAFRGDTEQIWGPGLSLFTQRPLWVESRPSANGQKQTFEGMQLNACKHPKSYPQHFGLNSEHSQKHSA